MGISCSSLRCCLPHRKQELRGDAQWRSQVPATPGSCPGSASELPLGRVNACRLKSSYFPRLNINQAYLPGLEWPASSATSEAPVFLPNDVIFDILSRVPVKALCRLRCVSREWCARISSPEFVTAHKSLRPAEPLLVVTSYPHKTLKLIDMDGCLVREINDMGKHWRPAWTGPDDVLCVVGYDEAIGYIAGVIDLATMKLLATRLERNVNDKAWGIGRAMPSGTWKVVRFTSHLSEVFTIGDGAGWRRTKSVPSNNDYYNLHQYPVAVNGVLYFLAQTQQDEEISILRFDLEREEWKDMIKGPPNVKIRWSTNLVELNGALCMVQQDIWKIARGHVNIWLLLDYDNSIWVNTYSIPFSPCQFSHILPLRVLHDGPKLLLWNMTRKGGPPILQIYDSRCGTCIDATKTLLLDHLSTVDCSVNIGLCNMQLEHFVSPKIPHVSTLSEVFL